MKQRSAFTLIELLIVVAIIAILAAIAVPNFLEAQTRSRVSRAMNDMRTIAVAMESYRIDNNSYIASDVNSPLEGHGSYSAADRRLLTTPVAYCSSVPPDIFQIIAGRSAPGYRIYALSYNSAGNPTYYLYPYTAWMTWSYGPDLVTNTGGYFSEKSVISNEALANPRIGVDRDGVIINTGTTGWYGMRYDSTNGTTSWGDIYRFDGEAKTR